MQCTNGKLYTVAAVCSFCKGDRPPMLDTRQRIVSSWKERQYLIFVGRGHQVRLIQTHVKRQRTDTLSLALSQALPQNRLFSMYICSHKPVCRPLSVGGNSCIHKHQDYLFHHSNMQILPANILYFSSPLLHSKLYFIEFSFHLSAKNLSLAMRNFHIHTV